MMYNVDTHKRVRRGRYKLVRETKLIKVQMSAMSGIREVVPVGEPTDTPQEVNPDV